MTTKRRIPMPTHNSASFQESILPKTHIKNVYPKGRTSIVGQNAFRILFCSLSSFISLGELNLDLVNLFGFPFILLFSPIRKNHAEY